VIQINQFQKMNHRQYLMSKHIPLITIFTHPRVKEVALRFSTTQSM